MGKSHTHGRNLLCDFRKYPYSPHGKSFGDSKGQGGLRKPNFFKGKYKAKLERSPEVWVGQGGPGGRLNQKPPVGEVHVWIIIFWDNTTDQTPDNVHLSMHVHASWLSLCNNHVFLSQLPIHLV